jgi:uncharacterized protein YcbX
VYVAEIWRYPVKSMAGEPLKRVYVDYTGLEGDRLVHAENAARALITARKHPRLLGHRGTLDEDGEPLVDGEPWNSPSVQQKIEASAGPGARLVRNEGGMAFDVLPLLVATDGAIAEFGHDRRRLRPNIILGGVEGLAEREWEGRILRIGEVQIEVRDLRARCVMTTYDPDTQEQDREVLREIARRFEGKLALNCFVAWPGWIQARDPVELRGE